MRKSFRQILKEGVENVQRELDRTVDQERMEAARFAVAEVLDIIENDRGMNNSAFNNHIGTRNVMRVRGLREEFSRVRRTIPFAG